MASTILKITSSYCRSNAYLMIGICLGLSLSLLFAPNDLTDDCPDCVAPAAVIAPESSSWDAPASTLSMSVPIDEYEPKINIEGKPKRAQKIPKAFIRPRYYSTELGIRDKLFVGFITSREYLHSRGLALNKTLAHLVDRVRYFISVPEGTKPNVSLPGIVGFTDTRNILKPFHVMKYITDNYLEDYDYYFIVKDASYINGRRLMELVEKISVSRDVHLGTRVINESYCTLDAGILLSNSLVRELKTSLDWCVKNTFSSSDDVNFGRCVFHASKISCSNEIQGKKFYALEIPTIIDFYEDFGQLASTKEKSLANSISIYPIYDHRTIYKINSYIAAIELRKVENEIKALRQLIVESSHLGPADNINKGNVSWPVGNEPGNRANGRFDILPWIYFNDTHSFMDTNFDNVRLFVGSEKIDFDKILKRARKKIEKKYENDKLIYQKLINGYRKFDASRGMDFILDLEFLQISNQRKIIKRIEICKPLGKVEILPVPYVTENSRVNIILVVDSEGKIEILNFLDRYENSCMEKKDKTFLMIVLLYEPDSPSKGTNDIFNKIKLRALELTEKYKKDQSKVTWLSVRLPISSIPIKIDPMLKIAIADLVTKKFTPESLLLFVESRTDLKIEYLNRVRMNTISQWQIYSPIPFVEYNPDVTQSVNSYKSNDIDINRNVGRYDHLNYETISFYAKDYTAMRRRISTEIPQVRSDREISTILGLSRRDMVESIFQLFVSFSDTHAFRAVEPALKIRYEDFNCEGNYSENVRNNCEKRKYYRLGHRGQLAKLILDYQNNY